MSLEVRNVSKREEGVYVVIAVVPGKSQTLSAFQIFVEEVSAIVGIRTILRQNFWLGYRLGYGLGLVAILFANRYSQTFQLGHICKTISVYVLFTRTYKTT